LTFGLYIADPKKLEIQKGYCGFGGIPGFIQVTIHPNTYNIPRIPAVIAHELGVKGFAEVSSYMFGDTIAKEQG
jgi:uncharacterized protein YjaZ